MKKMMMLVAGLLFAGSMAFAADAGDASAKKEMEKDTTHNPITGNTTVTTETTEKVDTAAGKQKTNVKHKVKKNKDGKVIETSTDADASAKH
jgi:ABC-type glycerol-3-phosphate transport system substrate-binding protein